MRADQLRRWLRLSNTMIMSAIGATRTWWHVPSLPLGSPAGQIANKPRPDLSLAAGWQVPGQLLFSHGNRPENCLRDYCGAVRARDRPCRELDARVRDRCVAHVVNRTALGPPPLIFDLCDPLLWRCECGIVLPRYPIGRAPSPRRSAKPGSSRPIESRLGLIQGSVTQMGAKTWLEESTLFSSSALLRQRSSRPRAGHIITSYFYHRETPSSSWSESWKGQEWKR